jgi:hypothetical protein
MNGPAISVSASAWLLLAGLAAQAEPPAAPLFFSGLCDASAAVALDSTLVAVADDEDNVIRVYDRRAGGFPLGSLNLSGFLRANPKEPEADIEGAARLQDRIYWITSHGRNLKGRPAPGRQRLFATTGSVTNGRIHLQPVGQPYAHLLRDLIEEPRLAPFHLAAAALLTPKAPGALNIEALAATPEGRLLIGFRNPVPQGRALVVPLLNPADVIEGRSARFGDPILLDLDGLGLRSLEAWNGRYLLVAGSYKEGGRSRLYEWDGGNTQPRRLDGVDFGGLNPESLACFEENGVERLFVVSDDGTVRVGRTECKRLKNPAQRQFRGLTLSP